MTTRPPTTPSDSLRKSAEEIVGNVETSVLESLSPKQTQQRFHELRVHKVELEMQNDELRRTQHELERARTRYFELYDLAPVGYLTLDEEGLVLEANLTAGILLEMPRNALLKLPITRFFLPEDQDIYYLKRKHLFDTNRTLTWDMRIVNSAGSTFWAHLQAVPAQNGECRVTLEDITARKHDESILAAILRISEYAGTHCLDELLTKVLDEVEALTGSTIGFFHFLEPDQETLTLQAWSTNTLKSMCTAEGKGQHYSVDKAGVWVECIHLGRPVIHNSYADLHNRKGLPPGHAPVERELVVPLFRDNRIVSIVGVGNKPADYQEQDIETVSRLVCFTWDTIVRKLSDESLQKSEKQYRTILHTLLDGFWIVDMQGRFIDVNEAYCTLIGYTRNELLEMGIQDVEALEDRSEIEQRMQRISSEGTHRFESRHRCKDGHLIDLDICVSYLTDHSSCCASLRDITERKRTERALESISSYNRSLIEASLDPLVAISLNGEITDVNEASTRVTGVPREQMIGSDYADYFTDPEAVRKGFHQTLSGAVLRDYPLDIRHVSGSVTNVLCNAVIFRDDRGEAVGVFAAVRDVSEIKKAQDFLKNAYEELEKRVKERTLQLAHAADQIRESEERLRFALKNSHTGMWEMNMRDKTAFHSAEHAAIFGYPEAQPDWSYAKFLEHVLPEDRPRADAYVREAMEINGEWNFECRIRRVDGKMRWISVAGRHLCDDAGNPLRSAGIVQDITNRKLAEEELHQLNEDLGKRVAERTASLSHTNELLRRANEEWLNTFNASSDPIFLLDTDHHIMRANRATADLLGLQVEDVIGRTCHEIIHECDAPATICPQCLLLADKRSHTAEVYLEKRGKYLLATVSPIFDAAGDLVGSIHYAKDITAIKQAEEALANANIELERKVAERTAELAQANEQMKKVSFELIWAEEKERERIAAELHDRVGQSLLLAKMKLDELEDRLPDDSLQTHAVVAASLIDSSIQDIRSLTFRMRPPLLDTAGIATSLEWLCSSVSSDYKLQVEFSDDGLPKPLSAETRYSLYQAVRELLINVAKHAGTHTAQLSMVTEDHTLVVHVADNGAGFDQPDALMKHVNNGGYGLYNVRQRIEQMGGCFVVESSPGNGTTVTLAVPLAES